MADRAFANDKIEFAWNSEVAEILGDDKLEGVVLRDTETGETRQIDATGLFVAIGHDPRSELVKGQVDLDDEGYVLVDGRDTATNLHGRLRLPATSSTTPTARPSPPPAPAARRRWTPSATCADLEHADASSPSSVAYDAGSSRPLPTADPSHTTAQEHTDEQPARRHRRRLRRRRCCRATSRCSSTSGPSGAVRAARSPRSSTRSPASTATR